MTLEEKFAQALERQAAQAVQAGLPAAKRLLRDAQQYGAAEAMRAQMGRRRLSDPFDQLADRGQLKLAPEALVISKEFGTLFSDEEADFCLQSLLEAGYFG